MHTSLDYPVLFNRSYNESSSKDSILNINSTFSIFPAAYTNNSMNFVPSIDPTTLQRAYEIFVDYEMEHNHSQTDVASPDLFKKIILELVSANHTEPSSAEIYEVTTGNIVILSLFYGVISLVAVVGNALVMWVVATSRILQTVTNYFIANLALADIIIGLFCIPFQFQAALLQRWNLPEFMCAFCPFFQTLSVNVSIFTLTAIAVDRYRAICFPFSTRPSKFRSRVVLVSIWALSSLLAVPTAVALRVTVHRDERTGAALPRCESRNMDKELFSTYSHLLVAIQYFLPLAIVSFAYLKIARKLWGSRTPGNAEDARDAHVLKNKKKAIKMLFVVVALFALCWLPLQSYHVLQVIYPHINDYKYINIIWFSFHWLAMSNSCVNPFIYAIYNEKFKREFRHKCQCCLLETGGRYPDLSEEERSRMSHHSSRFRSTRTSFLDTVTNRGSKHLGLRPSGGTASAEKRSSVPLSDHKTKRSSLKLLESGQPLQDLNALPPNGKTRHKLLSVKDMAAKNKSYHGQHLPGYFALRRNGRNGRVNYVLGSRVSKIPEGTSSDCCTSDCTSETSFNRTDSLPLSEKTFHVVLSEKRQQNGHS